MDVWCKAVTITRAQILLTTEVTIQLARYTTELNSVRSLCIDTVFAFCSVSQRSLELCTFVFVQAAQTSIPMHSPILPVCACKNREQISRTYLQKKLKKSTMFKYGSRHSNPAHHGCSGCDFLNDNFTDFYKKINLLLQIGSGGKRENTRVGQV
jgi:hypothetical protein